jgi:hypothetical protein
MYDPNAKGTSCFHVALGSVIYLAGLVGGLFAPSQVGAVAGVALRLACSVCLILPCGYVCLELVRGLPESQQAFSNPRVKRLLWGALVVWAASVVLIWLQPVRNPAALQLLAPIVLVVWAALVVFYKLTTRRA